MLSPFIFLIRSFIRCPYLFGRIMKGLKIKNFVSVTLKAFPSDELFLPFLYQYLNHPWYIALFSWIYKDLFYIFLYVVPMMCKRTGFEVKGIVDL